MVGEEQLLKFLSPIINSQFSLAPLPLQHVLLQKVLLQLVLIPFSHQQR